MNTGNEIKSGWAYFLAHFALSFLPSFFLPLWTGYSSEEGCVSWSHLLRMLSALFCAISRSLKNLLSTFGCVCSVHRRLSLFGEFGLYDSVRASILHLQVRRLFLWGTFQPPRVQAFTSSVSMSLTLLMLRKTEICGWRTRFRCGCTGIGSYKVGPRWLLVSRGNWNVIGALWVNDRAHRCAMCVHLALSLLVLLFAVTAIRTVLKW